VEATLKNRHRQFVIDDNAVALGPSTAPHCRASGLRVRLWPFCEVAADTEDVRLSGWTGSDWPTVKAALLTPTHRDGPADQLLLGSMQFEGCS
jgi:hypothetical protein